MANLATLRAKLAEMKIKTEAMRVQAEQARAKADHAKAEYESFANKHSAHRAVIAALQSKINETNAATAAIDSGLKKQDRAHEAGGSSGVGPRGGHYVIIRGKKYYTKTH